MARHNTVGELGESIAVQFLQKKGFAIKTTNVSRKWGELDIIAQKENTTVIAEVKAVTETVPEGVPQEGEDRYRPEENVTKEKKRRLARMVETLIQKADMPMGKWRVDLLCVYLDTNRKRSQIKWLQNIKLLGHDH